MLFQTSDTTWQAYNNYGGNSLYTGSPARQLARLQGQLQPAVQHARRRRSARTGCSTPSTRWCAGSKPTATTSATSPASTPTARGNLIPNHKRLHVGRPRRVLVGRPARQRRGRARRRRATWRSSAATRSSGRRAGRRSIDGSNTPYRTLVCYKETHANAKIDPPTADLDRHLARPALQPARRRRPAGERADAARSSWSTTARRPRSTVPSADGKMRFWRNTAVADLGAGQTATLPDGTLGYEWDSDARQRLASRRADRPVDDDGRRARRCCRTTARPTRSGTATHYLTLYRHASGALVFGAGTVQWAWGLDANHDRPARRSTPSMQQATVNLFADMGVQPATLQPGLVAGDGVHRHDGADVDDHLAGQRRDRLVRASGHDHRHGHRHRRRRRRRRRGLGRRRHDLAPRDRPRELDLRVDARGLWLGDHQEPRHRRQRQHRSARRRRHGHGRHQDLPLHDLGGLRHACGDERRRHRVGESRRASSAPTRTASSPGFASTRGPGTRARTSRRSGRAAGRNSRRRRSAARRRAAGSRSTSAHQCRSRRTPSTSPRIWLPTVTTPMTPVTSRPKAPTARRCMRCRMGSAAATACTPMRPGLFSRRRRTSRPTTGSMSSSRPARLRIRRRRR